MSTTTTSKEQAGTLRSPAGGEAAVIVSACAERTVGTYEEGVPAVLTEVDFECDLVLDVPGRAQLETADGRNLELEVVFTLQLGPSRYFYKGVAPSSGDDGDDDDA